MLDGLPAGDSTNLVYDAQLSLAIGGATGAFVGTDVSYGDANWLRGAPAHLHHPTCSG